MSNKLVEAYDRRYPGVDISDNQKEEREQRLRFKEETRALKRTTRNRGIIVPDLPWRTNGSSKA